LVTRREKREAEKNTNFFLEFIRIKNHFFKELNEKLRNVKDPRHQSYITYLPDVILYVMIIKNIMGLTSMRETTDKLNKDECIKNIEKVLGIEGLEELPHYDTINDFLSELDPSELERIRVYMIRELLKKRCFEDFRILGKYWGVIFDATGLYSFKERHCEHCLKREYVDKDTGKVTTIYMHQVLEAKLVIGDMVFSIGTEFIENEGEEVSKQDCELKAFYRLAGKIKEAFKRLPICILGDSLYACEGVFKLCDEYGWKFLIRYKEGRIKSVGEEFEAIKKIEGMSLRKREGDIEREDNIFWANEISYNERLVNLIEFVDKGEEGEKRYVFITDIKVTKKNALALVGAGRSRWKIENEGFNRQKNLIYALGHINSHNYNAMKNHYLLTQIADILMQLYTKGAKVFKIIKKTIKNISSHLLEDLRTKVITDEDMVNIMKPMQVRFT